MKCQSCDVPLKTLGVKKFHEVTRLGIFGEFAEFFEGREDFEARMCPECGELRFFFRKPKPRVVIPPEVTEALRAEIEAQYGKVSKHPLFATYLDGDKSRKFLSRKDRERLFLVWLQRRPG